MICVPPSLCVCGIFFQLFSGPAGEDFFFFHTWCTSTLILRCRGFSTSLTRSTSTSEHHWLDSVHCLISLNVWHPSDLYECIRCMMGDWSRETPLHECPAALVRDSIFRWLAFTHDERLTPSSRHTPGEIRVWPLGKNDHFYVCFMAHFSNRTQKIHERSVDSCCVAPVERLIFTVTDIYHSFTTVMMLFRGKCWWFMVFLVLPLVLLKILQVVIV